MHLYFQDFEVALTLLYLNVLISLVKIQVCFKVWYNISTALTRKVLCGLLFTLLYFTLLNQPISKFQT